MKSIKVNEGLHLFLSIRKTEGQFQTIADVLEYDYKNIIKPKSLKKVKKIKRK